MKNLLFTIVFLFASLFAVNLKTGAPIRENPKGGSELVAVAVDSMEFTIEKTYSYRVQVRVEVDSDHVGKIGWVDFNLLEGNKIGGQGVNLRETKVSGSDIVCSVRAGAIVRILDTAYTWMLLNNGAGISGWTWEDNIKTE